MSLPILRRRFAPALVLALLIGCRCAGAAELPAGPVASEQASFRIVEVVAGLEQPWAMAFLPEGNILITERPGRLRIVRGSVLDPTPIRGLPPIRAQGQGGLLDIALHPNFEANRRVYLSYAAGNDERSGTRVARARFRAELLEELEVVFVARPLAPGGGHFGSRLAFDREGLLYVTLGERRVPAGAQKLDQHFGKIVRIRPAGQVPADNPFVGHAGARPEIFTLGHRNPQGLAVHPETGAVWAHEHGPRGGDEVNLIRAGGNYGWPVITHGIGYGGSPIGEGTHKPGMEQPVHFWVPSIAPSGMAFYDGEAFPEWRGDLFVGALAGQHLARLELDGEEVVAEERLLGGILGRIRDVGVGPDGFLYLLTGETEGGLYRLEPDS